MNSPFRDAISPVSSPDHGIESDLDSEHFQSSKEFLNISETLRSTVTADSGSTFQGVPLFEHPSTTLSAKVNGRRYICVVKSNGSCDLIAHQYSPETISTRNILMVLDCELVNIFGNMHNEELSNSTKTHSDVDINLNSSFGGMLVVFDVLTLKSDIPVYKKLHTLECLLWSGECKLCGMFPDQCADKYICPISKSGTCLFGLKLKHPWFARAVVKRSVSIDRATSEFFGSSIFANKRPDILNSLFDGVIVDNKSEECQEDFCYKLKCGRQLTVDILVDAKEKAPSSYPLPIFGKLRLPHSYNYVATPFDVDTSSIGLYANMIPVIVECYFDIQNKKWIGLKIRHDKLYPNTTEQAEKIIKLSHVDDISKRLSTLLIENSYERRSDGSKGFGIFLTLRESNYYLKSYKLNETALRTNIETTSSILDILLDHKCVDLSDVSQLLTYYCEEGLECFYSILIQASTKALEEYRKSALSFHRNVKRLLYTLFPGSVMIDIGPGKLNMKNLWQETFKKVVGVEKNIQFVQDIAKWETPSFTYEEMLSYSRSLVLLEADACAPNLSKKISSALNYGASEAEIVKANVCFAFFSFQGVLSSEATFHSFMSNLLPNLEDDAALVTLLLDGDAAICQHESSYVSSARVYSWSTRRSWVGGVAMFSGTYSKEATEEVTVMGVADPTSKFNMAMRKYGMEITTVLPLEEFHHFLPTHQALRFEKMDESEKAFSDMYRLAIWKRNKRLACVPLDFEKLELSASSSAVDSVQGSSASAILPEAPPTLDTLLGMARYNFDGNILSQIYDFLDIESHINLALSSKATLRAYIRGYSSHPMLSHSAIANMTHIRAFMQARKYSLFKLFTCQSNSFRAINPVVYKLINSLGCLRGCALCTCIRSKLMDRAQERGVRFGYSIPAGLAPYEGYRLEEPIDDIPPVGDNNLQLYPYEVNHNSFFCFCNHCFAVAPETKSITGYGKSNYRSNKMILHMNPQDLDSKILSRVHRVSNDHKQGLLVMLVLKSLFSPVNAPSRSDYDVLQSAASVDTIESADSDTASSSSAENRSECNHLVEKMLREMMPEIFDNASWQSDSVQSFLHSSRVNLDDRFVSPWLLLEYNLANHLLQRGSPFPSFLSVHSPNHDYDQIIEDQDGEEIPLDADAVNEAISKTRSFIQQHATWEERWVAARFRRNKRLHYLERFFDDFSDGEEYTDITPFHAARW